jgi:hypothetical protein
MHYSVKTWESGCIDPRFLDLGSSWRWVVGFTLLPLYPRGKSHLYPLDRRLGGPQSLSGRYGEVKILDPTGIQTPTPRSVQHVASRYMDWATGALKIYSAFHKEERWQWFHEQRRNWQEKNLVWVLNCRINIFSEIISVQRLLTKQPQILQRTVRDVFLQRRRFINGFKTG